MGTHTVLMPDVGEGIAEAEILEWPVQVGDKVREDDVLSIVMTDKAAVEVPSSVQGEVLWLAGEAGDTVAIGAPLIKLRVEGEGNASDVPPNSEPAISETPVGAAVSMPPASVTGARQQTSSPTSVAESQTVTESALAAPSTEKPLASPAVRKRALDTGVDLRQLQGTGPAGRIVHEDLEGYLAPAMNTGGGRTANTAVTTVKVIGMRRKIAQQMALAKARIPHITIIEEVDMTSLQELRCQLNEQHAAKRDKLSLLPFMMRAMVEAVREQPAMNAHYDDEAELIHQHGAVHIGIATQTPNGLAVPVVRHAESLNPWQAAAELSRLAGAARDGKAKREELQGSTITLSSLGALGAIATTPIINHPEVAIVAVNKIAIRPQWDGQQFQPRKMMNISCAFDHRVIDGWDAAVFVQRLKSLLETPALLFVES